MVTTYPPLRYAVGLPNIREYADPRVLATLGSVTEASGWDALFIWDHLADADPAAPVTDPWISIAAAACATSRIELGIMVTPLARRRPWQVARESVAMDMLSDGRFRLGVGLGGDAQAEFAAFGDDPTPRGRAARLDEGLQILTGLWSGQPLSHHGEHFDVETRFAQTPTRSGGIPIWIAGAWPNRAPFRRAARFDGVFPVEAGQGHTDMMTPETLREIIELVAGQRTRPESFDVVLEGHSEGHPASADRARVTAYREAGLTWWVEKLGWFRGELDDVRARIIAGPPRVDA